jgi:hypothetical protein
VEVTFHNPARERTEATFGIIRSAPLGVFLPWEELGYILVPALEPGESIVVASEYECDKPESLGSIDKVPPERVLTALGSEEPGRRRRRQSRPSVNPAPARDLLAMLTMGGIHWAGNINVFFPTADVERHAAQAMRIHPGRTNMADFIIGKPAEEYQFHLDGHAAEWNAKLYDTKIGLPILAGTSTPELEQGRWIRPACGIILLSVEPPAEAKTGAVNVRVRQKSTGRQAVVEFAMDSNATGPGCYKL